MFNNGSLKFLQTIESSNILTKNEGLKKSQGQAYKERDRNKHPNTFHICFDIVRHLDKRDPKAKASKRKHKRIANSVAKISI